MLSDEQRGKLTDRAAHAIRRADGNHNAGAGSLGEHVAEALAELIEQWISEAVADALESGELPDGWERHTEYGGMGYDHDQACCIGPDRADLVGHHPVVKPRTVITGPWGVGNAPADRRGRQ